MADKSFDFYDPHKEYPLEKGEIEFSETFYSKNPLSEEEKQYYTEKYSLLPYHFDTIEKFLSMLDVSGKRVLEVGGFSFPEELVCKRFGAKNWVCVDQVSWKKKTDNIAIYPLEDIEKHLFRDPFAVFKGNAEMIANRLENRFDIVFSCCCFEHVLSMLPMLNMCYDSLRPEGIMWSNFGPIWSSPIGSHYYLSAEDNFACSKTVAGWTHLIMSPPAFYEYLRRNYDRKDSQKILHQVFHSEVLNRLFFEDYVHYMAVSPFERYKIQILETSSPPDEQRRQLLKERHPQYKRFDITDFLYIGQKLATGKAGLGTVPERL